MNGLMKGMGILLIVSAMIWTGIHIAGIYKKRGAFWEQMIALCTFLQNEIRYTAARPSDVFLRFDWQPKVWGQDVSYFSFEQAVVQISEDLKLESKEHHWLLAFYQGLGTTDLEGQLAHLATYGRLFEQRLQLAREHYAVKGKLYRSLTALGGLMVAVLLI